MSLFDQIPVPELLGEGEGPLDEYLDSDQPEHHTVKEFCRSVLATREYRESLLRRIDSDELPPAIEAMLYHYAFGKPAERFEHTGKDGRPIESVTEVRRIIVHVEAQAEPDLEENTKVSYTRH